MQNPKSPNRATFSLKQEARKIDPIRGKMEEMAFHEMTRKHMLRVTGEIRNQATTLEEQWTAEKERYAKAIAQVKKSVENKREMDRMFDMDYKLKMTEALDAHLTDIRSEAKKRAEAEERKLAEEANEVAEAEERKVAEEANEVAEKFPNVVRTTGGKMEEMAFHEMTRKHMLRVTGEIRNQATTLEEQWTAEKERYAKAIAEVEKSVEDKREMDRMFDMDKLKMTEALDAHLTDIRSEAKKRAEAEEWKLAEEANEVAEAEERKVAEDANEVAEKFPNVVRTTDIVDLRSKEYYIAWLIDQTFDSVEDARSKTSEILDLFNDPSLPKSLTIAVFAKQLLSIYEKPDSKLFPPAFVCHLVVLLSAQEPAVMDSFLAEFHKACMYTIPEHITYSEEAFQTKQSYFKAIGFREEGGNLETMNQYLARLTSYMELYGVLVQTEAEGVQNMHGLDKGWTWIARFLNKLPANLFTAVALEAFLRMAGSALHRKYQNQFMKILSAIYREFVPKLKAIGDPQTDLVATLLEDYLCSGRFQEDQNHVP